jgi:hypothetical protein
MVLTMEARLDGTGVIATGGREVGAEVLAGDRR